MHEIVGGMYCVKRFASTEAMIFYAQIGQGAIAYGAAPPEGMQLYLFITWT